MRRAIVLLAFGSLPVLLSASRVSVRGQELFDVPLRINMGGAETVDSLGRVWLGDGPGAGDPLNIRPEDAGGSNFAENWALAAAQADSFEALGFDLFDPGDSYIFNTIRWDDGVLPPNFILEIPLPQGEYTVNLYMLEGCCPGRHFKIEIQGEILDDDVSYLDYDPLNPVIGRLGILQFEDTAVGEDQILRIGLLPCPECPGATDINAILNALEVVSGPDCNHLGLDFNCVFDPGSGEVTGTWLPIPGAEGWRILKNGTPLGADLPAGTTSFLDVTPSAGGSRATYVVQALDGGVPISQCSCSLNVVLCPRNLVCTSNVGGEVGLSWDAAVGWNVTGYEVRRNGQLLGSLPGTATTYEDEPATRVAEYTITPITAPPGSCGPLSCSAIVEGAPFAIPLRINMGGATTVDSKGRTWLGDGPGPGDPLDIRPDDLGGANTNVNWCVPVAETLSRYGLDADHPGDRTIFGTIRWDDAATPGDFYIELPVPDGEYTVIFYFIDCCCPNRHFKIEINDEVLDPDVSMADYDPAPANGKVGRLSFSGIETPGGIIRIGLLPCPECPGATDINAIVSAIEVISDPCTDPSFRQCPGSLNCSFEPATGGVTGTWEGPLCFAVEGYDLRRNGTAIGTLPASATSFTDTLAGRVGYYEVVPRVSAGDDPCAPISCVVINPAEAFEIPLRINMGGPFAVDSLGRRWIGDGPGAGDILDIRVDDLGGVNTIVDWCVLASVNGSDSLRSLGYDAAHPGDRTIFSSLRWDCGDDPTCAAPPVDPTDDIDFRLEIPVPNGTYDLNLFFTECSSPGRHFKIELQGEIEVEDLATLLVGGTADLGRTGRVSFEDVSVTGGFLSIGFLPCYECPPDPGITLDANAIINAIELVPASTVQRTCPRDLTCEAGVGGEVIGSWSSPENVSVSGYELYRNGERIATLPSSATQFDDDPPCVRATVYELAVLSSAADFPCPGIRLRCVHVRPECLTFATPLRINMGGALALDSRGDFWLADGPGAGDPLEIRPDDLGGAQYGENWQIGFFQADSLDALGFSGTHPGDRYIFNTIRWDDGGVPPDFLIEIPLDDGVYTVNLYFNEGFPSERHFKISIQDEIVEEDASYLMFDPVRPERGRVGRLSYPGVEVFDNFLRIGLLPCPLCPGVTDINPIIDAIEVLEGGSVAAVFRRGDADASDGVVNITDAIFVLNYLFQGGNEPPCLDAADADNEFGINITDGIYILSYLFLGGPEPPAPGPSTCGPDPAQDPPSEPDPPLDCQSYPPSCN